MNTTLEKVEGFDVLHVEGQHTWEDAMRLSEECKGMHGIDDWVLPDAMTLSALGIISPEVDEVHWSASPYVGNPNVAWVVNFSYGVVDVSYRYYSYRVRLVRTSQCLDIGAVAQKKSMKEAGIL